MPYTETNYRSKAELRRALERGETVRVYQPGPFGPDVPDGVAFLEGPHYPEPHRWYGQVTVRNGVIIGGVK